ncbi:MAG: GNAT family N-acetyltransferase [Janthinobacterium lividum]
MPFTQAVTLRGALVTLEPLASSHHDDLVAAASDGQLWKLWYTSVPTPVTMAAYITTALLQQEQGLALPFAIRDNQSGRLVGTSRYCNIDSANRRLEIGYTWYAASAQRTGINTESKKLLLSHAFEQLACIAVELRTHWINQQSRAAIARLGAKQDGILRNHQLGVDGQYRDTVVFSITNLEWATVKRHLEFKLDR